MPELPEVETIRSQMAIKAPFKILAIKESQFTANLLYDRSFEPLGKVCKELSRKGKILHFLFEENGHILSNLGMSGSWRVSDFPLEEKHTHLQLKCQGENNSSPFYLSYIDPRRFGFLYFSVNEVAKEKLAQLGPDAAGPDFNFEHLYPLIKKYPNRPIKPFLLEQKFVAGIGNYMASEICAHAGIRPTRKNKTLRKIDIENIIKGTRIVIEGAVKRNGNTFSGGYMDTTGSPGKGLSNLLVFYQKVCGVCEQTEVKKIVLAQRGTYYCPRCQK